MITYIVFYLLLLTITFFKDRKMGFILGCIILGVFSSARYYVGADYGYYYEISTQAGRDFYFSNKWFYYNYNLEMDFFKLLSDFALSIECPRLPIIIFAGLNSYFLYKILSTQKFKISKLLVYASFPLFYTLSFTTIPQSLSSLIILYSFLLFKKKKFIKSLMLVLFSVYVHKSALIIIFIFLGLGFILVNKTRIKFFIALLIFMLFLSVEGLLNLLDIPLNTFTFQNYLIESKGAGGNKILILVNLLALIFLLSKKFYSTNNKLFFLFGFFVFNLLSDLGNVSFRSSYPFLLVFFFFEDGLYRLIKNEKLYSFIFYISLFILFMLTFYIDSNSADPKLVPYKI